MPHRRLGLALALLSSTLVAMPTSASAAAGDTEITVVTCAPYETVTLGNAGVCGADVLDALFTGLTEYDPVTGRSSYAVAKSITTRDNRRFTVTLRKGWTFHDGTPVKARNFVEAWNQTAFSKGTSSFLFEDIKGYGTRRMSGLKVIDDHTFTIELNRPFGPFVKKLGQVAFSPLPDSILAKPSSFAAIPVGDGPFQLTSGKPGSDAVVERYDGYAGTVRTNVSKITYQVFSDWDASYRALISGDVDFVGLIPYSKLTRYKKDLHGRVIDRAGNTLQTVDFPISLATDADFRKAISMAIDRETITKRVFAGLRVPAHSFVSPVAEGARRNACGQVCAYNPSLARRYLAKAMSKGFRPPAALPLYYNADSAHGEWVDALAASVNKTFNGKVKIVPTGIKTYDEFMKAQSAGTLHGMFRAGWVLDFPHIQNALGPLYASDGYANYSVYQNKKFDGLLNAADRQISPAKAIKLYQRAESLLVKDMPAIPLWFYRDLSGYSAKITTAKLTPFGWLDPNSVTVS
ncbi:ABC transporter substrate-binding protein [Planotetraspora sp. A-T 1434]|uniref:peptide ABC transporter substrate-binding protein n=1 Tax=Planotetraspora sp. A-T 1434 TaxID=2979219 RepID=UPI0021C14378|nr:ABC transporter substrate-binding protein [Planotetraspora sp. A-T 1434]MCT9931639.1 ABC transporter substrate-binding protein [Planotetraspora sp. A-T 1434]